MENINNTIELDMLSNKLFPETNDKVLSLRSFFMNEARYKYITGVSMYNNDLVIITTSKSYITNKDNKVDIILSRFDPLKESESFQIYLLGIDALIEMIEFMFDDVLVRNTDVIYVKNCHIKKYGNHDDFEYIIDTLNLCYDNEYPPKDYTLGLTALHMISSEVMIISWSDKNKVGAWFNRIKPKAYSSILTDQFGGIVIAPINDVRKVVYDNCRVESDYSKYEGNYVDPNPCGALNQGPVSYKSH